ncbi:hypothetical protein JCM6882_008079 [Rhodosporidiobolus microsporus]
MFSTTSPLLAVAAVLALAAKAVDALAITSPSVTTIWDVTGTNPNYVLWQTYPLTYPPPATQFFDIWIRNAVGAMYTPPLNTTLATGVDSSTLTYFQVTDVAKFIPGPGYQLFFADPTNPDIVYCDSDVFSIGTPDVGAAPITPSSSATDGLPSSTPSSGVGGVTQTTSTTTALVSATGSTSAGELVAATVPGGPAEQGFNLLNGAVSSVAATLGSVVAAVGVGIAVLAV